MSEKKTRGWCFTVPNYEDIDILQVLGMYEADSNAKYLIVGFEVCPRTGTRHMQCYIYYTNALRTSEFAKRRYKKFHFEAQKASSNVNAYSYCMKDGEYFEIGERPRQGNRTDLEVIKHDIETGKTMKDVAQQYFSQWCQYRRSFDAYKDMITEFDTKLIMYDDTTPFGSMKMIYAVKSSNDLIVDSTYAYTVLEIAKIYYSKQYRYIFFPLTKFMDQEFKDRADGYLDHEGIKFK